MDVVLSIRGLFAGYDRGDILRGVDLDVERGGVTCVIGPNGAGKSTVLMGGYVLSRAALRRRIDEIVSRFPIVRERRRERAGSLSGGEQKLVEIARAMILEPRVVLMDEPSMGLDPKARRVVFATIRQL